MYIITLLTSGFTGVHFLWHNIFHSKEIWRSCTVQLKPTGQLELEICRQTTLTVWENTRLPCSLQMCPLNVWIPNHGEFFFLSPSVTKRWQYWVYSMKQSDPQSEIRFFRFWLNILCNSLLYFFFLIVFFFLIKQKIWCVCEFTVIHRIKK